MELLLSLDQSSYVLEKMLFCALEIEVLGSQTLVY
jgi:hypothetical protein